MPSTAAVSPITRPTKSLLLTLLGSAVAPRRLDLWQETLVKLLISLGAGTAAARQAVARAVRDDWLVRQRVGRRTRMTLTESAHRQLMDAHARTMVFGQPRQWNGEWLLIALTIPEESRSVRHHFRTQLAWLGFGSLGNGIWVSPHTENETAANALFEDAREVGDAFVFTGARPANRAPEEIAAAAWSLDDLRRRYEDFCHRFSKVSASEPEDVLRAWTDLTTSWRHFPLFDPELPDRLLPANWPRQRAYELFHSRSQEWAPRVIEYLLKLDAEVQG